MLKETGTVVAVEEDGLWVETLKLSTCAKCAAKQGCGQRLLGSLSPASNMTFIKAFFTESSRNDVWQTGDQVVLGVEENALVVAAILAYCVPLAGFLVGLFMAANVFGTGDAGTAVGALLGLAGGGLLVKSYSRVARSKDVFQAYVLNKAIAVQEY